MRTWVEMRSRWMDWANLILGAWIFVSPWVFHTIYAGSASPGDFWWTGGAIFVVAIWALTAPWARWTEWINGLLAIWLFISPWVLGFAGNSGVAWDAWIVGVIVFLLALWSLSMARRQAGGPLDMDDTLPRRPRGRRRALR